MLDADHGGLGNVRVANREVFEVDGRDPLPAVLITSLTRSVGSAEPCSSSVATIARVEETRPLVEFSSSSR
jgi:hypothetical protein